MLSSASSSGWEFRANASTSRSSGSCSRGALFQLAKPAPALGARFYAPPIRVHRGDTIKFVGAASVAPANVRIRRWIHNNAQGVGKKWSIAVRDKDEGKQHLKINKRVAFNAQRGCGWGANPCAYDGSRVRGSGVF